MNWFDTFSKQVESEIMRHGFPSFEDGHEQGLWDGLPISLCLAIEGQAVLDIANEVMWWHDGTQLVLSESQSE